MDAGYFVPSEIKRLLDEHDKGIADNRKQLWTMLSFALWHERYGPGTRPSAPVEEPSDGESSVVLRC